MFVLWGLLLLIKIALLKSVQFIYQRCSPHDSWEHIYVVFSFLLMFGKFLIKCKYFCIFKWVFVKVIAICTFFISLLTFLSFIYEQVLIFSGNKISTLPWNVFGTMNNHSELRVIDMSNNGIKEIRGKSYHHVPNVERLILNHNEISIATSEPNNHHHPR